MDFRSWAVVPLTVLCALQAGPAFCVDLFGSADLSYTYTADELPEERTTGSQFQQAYSLGARQQLTPVVGCGVDLRALLVRGELGDSPRDDTNLYSTLSLDANNRFLDMNVNYLLTREERAEIRSMNGNTWNANITTKFRKLPKLRFLYSLDHQEEETEASAEKAREDGSRMDLSLDYDVGPFSLFYSYYRFDLEESQEGLRRKGESHSGVVTFQRSLWKDRIGVNVSYKTRGDNSEATSSVGDFQFLEKREPIEGLYAIDTTPLLGTLESRPGLIDGDTATGTGIQLGGIASGGGTDRNMGVDLSFSQGVDKVYVYTTTVPDRVDFDRFSWDVYSSEDGDQWELVVSRASFLYSTLQRRFEIDLPRIEGRYFKVVNAQHDPVAPEIEVSEIEILALVAEGERYATSSLTNNVTANLSTYVTDRLMFAYNLIYDEVRRKPDPEADKLRFSQTFTAKAEPIRDLSTQVQVLMQDETLFSTERKTTSYSFQVSANPLESITGTFSYTHSDVDERSAEPSLRSVDSSVLYTLFTLYPGVDLRVDLTVNLTRDPKREQESHDEAVYVYLYLDLLKSLRLETRYSGVWRTNKVPDMDRIRRNSHRIENKLLYRPSRRLFFTAFLDLLREDEGTKFLQDYSLDWLVTDSVQTILSGVFLTGEENSQTFSSQVIWNIGRNFIVRFTYAFSRQEREETVQTQNASIKFSAIF